MDTIDSLLKEREPLVVPDANSGDFITVREAYNTFVRQGDIVSLVKSFDEHRQEDRASFTKVDTQHEEFTDKIDERFSSLDGKIDELKADKLPKWFLPTVIALGSLLSPTIVHILEKVWK